jgi:S1-C subfamily serine protease
LIDEQFDDTDLRDTSAMLRAAAHRVTVVGREAGLAVAARRGKRAIVTERAACDVSPDAFDALWIAGESAVEGLCADAGAVALARAFVAMEKLVVAPSRAPALLAAADVVRDRVMTSCPSLCQELLTSGAQWVDREVVTDRNLITSRTRAGAYAMLQERLASPAMAGRDAAAGRAAGSGPRSMWAAALFVAFLAAAAPVFVAGDDARGQTSGASELRLEDEWNTAEVFERSAPSVVSIEVTIEGRAVSPFGLPGGPLRGPLRDLLPEMPSPEPLRGSGSGFVVDDARHILTNYHVVRAALQPGSTQLRTGANVTVRFSMVENGVEARVLGANALYDLALLEIDAGALPQGAREIEPIELGSSSEIVVGQKAIAIGNPFGFASTVTIGIVSGIGRSLPGVGEMDIPLVQTDAAINPGSSGGPLLDSSGRLIGVNTAIIPGGWDASAGFVGLAFAVPADLVRETLPSLLEGDLTDVTTRARLGIAAVGLDTYPDAVRESLGLPDQGVAVAAVEPSSPAAEAGLRGAQFEVTAGGISLPGGMDVIVAIDGKDVRSPSILQQAVFAHEEGDEVTLVVICDGERREVGLKLQVFDDGDTRDTDAQAMP